MEFYVSRRNLDVTFVDISFFYGVGVGIWNHFFRFDTFSRFWEHLNFLFEWFVGFYFFDKSYILNKLSWKRDFPFCNPLEEWFWIYISHLSYSFFSSLYYSMYFTISRSVYSVFIRKFRKLILCQISCRSS